MSLRGDLATMDLGDLLRNLEMHSQSGLLTVEGPQGLNSAYVDGGKLVLFAAEGRPGLIEVLVACGQLSAADVERARKKRKRSGKSLGEVLVAMKLITVEALQEVATARLLSDVCELLAADSGAFQFSDTPIPRGLFDPEERRLGLGLPIEPVLLEAARRMDHWRMVRQRVPSDSAHYLVQGRALNVDASLGTLCDELLARLDGTHSVSEAMAAFPHQRFEAYQLLAELVTSRVVRAAGAPELAALAREVRAGDPERAWEVVRRGLDVHPQHLELLCEQALLAEAREEPVVACEALKMAAHLHLESGEQELARASLDHARRLQPMDTGLLERSLSLALDADDLSRALAEGNELAGLYREPGLHRKAQRVFERLLKIAPEDWELHRELARSTVDSGEPQTAVAELMRFGRQRLARNDYEFARAAFAEVLEFDPSHPEAGELLEQIDGKVIQRRRARRKRIVRRTAAVVLGLAGLVMLVFEGAARRAYGVAERTVSQRNLIEERRYADAAALFSSVSERYAYTATGLLDVPARVRELERKQVQSGATDSVDGREAPLPATFAEPDVDIPSSVSFDEWR